MFGKQGASELVAWVLLIGFSISMGVLVTQWLREQAKTSAESVIKDIEHDLRCSDVALNAYFSSATDCTLTVSNRGYHKIVGVKVRSEYGVNEFLLEVQPGESASTSLYANFQGVPVEIIPVISVDNQKYGCVDRRVSAAC